jgi:tetratricopeptide (TPR) repeat protein
MPLLRIALLLLLTAGPLFAADTAAEVKEHIKAGQTHYAIGEFEDAIKEFRLAYKLRQDPGLLFNIAQCARQLHDYQQAYFHYRQYLNQRPDAANKTEVQSLIEQMRRRIDEEQEQKTRVARDPAAAGNFESTLPGPVDAQPGAAVKAPAAAIGGKAPAGAEASHPARIAGYVVLGLGVVAEGAAFMLHSSAQSAADQFNQKYAAGTLTAADAKLKSDAQSKGKLATAALAGGLALLATSAVLCFAF